MTAHPSSDSQQSPINVSPAVALALELYKTRFIPMLQALVQESVSKGLDAHEVHVRHFQERFDLGFSYLEPHLKELWTWLFESHENTNFTYNLSELNLDYLSWFVADITAQPRNDIRRYIDELLQDRDLAMHIDSNVRGTMHEETGDPVARYCRRIGWYALTRAMKPRVTIETGVDKGLGSCVICAALLRNQDEGHPGKYYGTDINPNAGYLLSGRYASVGKLLIGDSITSLKSFSEPIDIFINDSDHSSSYEAQEYVTIEKKLSPRAVVLGDNSHVTKELSEFADRTGRKFSFFMEMPTGHWYPGAGIGAAYR